jgi:NitT/TauT family transport system substrate-binding protein
MRVKTFLFAALIVALSGAAAHAQTKIRLSYIVPVSNWATMLMQKKDLMKHEGKSYTLEIIHFRGTPELITALATGELEVANLGFTTLPLAVVNAGLSDLRIISDELQDGVPGYYSNEFLVRKDGPIQKWEDLKGKVVTSNAYGSGTDIPLRVMLAKHGLQDKRDVTIIEAPIPTMPAMLAEQKTELVILPLPFTANPKTRAATRRLGTAGDAVGINQLGMWAARASVIEKNRNAFQDFMEDALRVERWYLDPKNHDGAVQAAMAITKTPKELWDSWLFRKDGQNGDYYRNPEGKPDIDALQKATDLQVQHGFLKQTIDVKRYVDMSLMEEAVRRLR